MQAGFNFTKVIHICREALANQVKLSHHDIENRLWLCSDSTETGWAAILTQILGIDMETPAPQQQHEHLSIQSSRFNIMQLQ